MPQLLQKGNVILNWVILLNYKDGISVIIRDSRREY